jgi:hypothetical protein
MSNWTRRKVLFGIASVPLLFRTLARTSHAEQHPASKRPRNLAAGAQFQWLNVIIHGMMTMEISSTDKNNGVILTFPEVGGDKPHYYLAGSFDRAKPVPPPPPDSLFEIKKATNYVLSGVNPGNVKPVFKRADGNFILDNSGSSYKVDRSNRTFTLPWPGASASVRRLCRADVQPFLDKTPARDPNATLKQIATIHVFSYTLKSGVLPVITGNGTKVPWTPLGSVFDPPGYANLHIFAEPKQPVDSSHAIMAFTEMMKIISKGGTSLEKQYTFGDFGDPRKNLGSYGSDPNILGLDPVFDYQNLPQQQATAGGEVANCVRTILAA